MTRVLARCWDGNKIIILLFYTKTPSKSYFIRHTRVVFYVACIVRPDMALLCSSQTSVCQWR